eukprot:scaffold92835_cov66-Phaeocystis_antarctica.AAC.6
MPLAISINNAKFNNNRQKTLSSGARTKSPSGGLQHPLDELVEVAQALRAKKAAEGALWQPVHEDGRGERQHENLGQVD